MDDTTIICSIIFLTILCVMGYCCFICVAHCCPSDGFYTSEPIKQIQILEAIK